MLDSDRKLLREAVTALYRLRQRCPCPTRCHDCRHAYDLEDRIKERLKPPVCPAPGCGREAPGHGLPCAEHDDYGQ